MNAAMLATSTRSCESSSTRILIKSRKPQKTKLTKRPQLRTKSVMTPCLKTKKASGISTFATRNSPNSSTRMWPEPFPAWNTFDKRRFNRRWRIFCFPTLELILRFVIDKECMNSWPRYSTSLTRTISTSWRLKR